MLHGQQQSQSCCKYLLQSKYIKHFMKGDQIQKLIKKDLYQVFILDSPVSFPLWLFRHSYIVVNDRGTLTRWDVFHRNYGSPESKDYLHKNFARPWVGLGVFYMPIFRKKVYFKSRLITYQEGGSQSLAQDMVTFINTQAYHYPHVSDYNMVFGPNSNSFTQWFLDQFPRVTTLPRMAHGRSYKVNDIHDRSKV
jgi:hypothetical protein